MQALRADDIIENIDFMPIELKTTLIEKLLGSIHQPQSDIDKAWLDECEDRLKTCAGLKDGSEVFKNINSRLQK